MATTTDSVTRRFAAAFGLLGATVAQEGRSNAQPLTIFYGGMVVEVDGCTPEKADELISLAAGQDAPQPPVPAPALVNTPIARKESLRRFLSKRKEKVRTPVPDSEPAVAVAPYEQRKGDEATEPPVVKKVKLELSGEEAATWLALGSVHAR